ncbi:hypothetical protein EVAR_56204_1 [Eumeta japonica]|uniref:Uncharacterized protein n=1 Tax=Eumeta variegata TaxID=151549 RepID=A0A4C1Y7B1_EUMVA|nr:hypothetical protein EVAR_56204_1 [Eumeta japonica]
MHSERLIDADLTPRDRDVDRHSDHYGVRSKIGNGTPTKIDIETRTESKVESGNGPGIEFSIRIQIKIEGDKLSAPTWNSVHEIDCRRLITAPKASEAGGVTRTDRHVLHGVSIVFDSLLIVQGFCACGCFDCNRCRFS